MTIRIPETDGVNDKDRHIKLADLDQLMPVLESRIDELDRQMDRLPDVDRKDRPDDPSAETQYAMKKSKAQHVKWRVDELKQYVWALTREIQKCHKRLGIVEEGRAKLNNADAKTWYNYSRGGLLHEIDRLEKKRESVNRLIRRAEEALSHAADRAWPWGEPKERISDLHRRPHAKTTPGPTRLPPSGGRRSASPPFDEELGAVMKKDPRDSDKT